MFKYVIDSNNNLIMSSKTLTHQKISAGLEGKPVSAGFVDFAEDMVGVVFPITSGESISLNLKARKEDDTIIKRHMEDY